MNNRIINSIIPLTSTLKDVLKTLDTNPLGIVFIINSDGCLKGIMTDGDIRRALLNDASLDENVQKNMVNDFIFGKKSNTKEQNINLLNDFIQHLPILDDFGQIVDYISVSDFVQMPVMEPTLKGNELEYVNDCIKTNWISSQGNYVQRFENAFAQYHSINHALSTTNGTSALHLALMAFDIGPGDEVIVPDLTFAASANAVIHCGAKPVLIDVHPNYWNIDPNLIEQSITSRTRAIMPVHLYGHPCDMAPILKIAKKHNMFVIEDCAEALGAQYNGQLVGTFGDAGCFSFFSNKIITTGEGGMVITRHSVLSDKMEILKNHGMKKDKRYWHEFVGFNYRMTNIQAAIGLAQIEQLDLFLERRNLIETLYNKFLKDTDGIELPPKMDWGKKVNWLYSILIDEEKTGVSRDLLIQKLKNQGIETRPFFYPLHIQPPFEVKRDFPVSTKLSQQGISLPSSINLSGKLLKKICDAIKDIFNN